MTSRHVARAAQLPATLIEAEATAFARDRITQMRSSDFGNTGTGAFDPLTAHVILKRFYRHVAGGSVEGLSWVAGEAITSRARAAHEVLLELKHAREERNEPLGSVLNAYDIRQSHAPFQAHPGPAREAEMIQNIAFCVLIIQLAEKFGLDPTRRLLVGKKTRLPSACDVVAQAAAEAGLHRGGPDAFRKIWTRFAPGILNGFRVTSPEALALLVRHGECRV